MNLKKLAVLILTGAVVYTSLPTSVLAAVTAPRAKEDLTYNENELNYPIAQELVNPGTSDEGGTFYYATVSGNELPPEARIPQAPTVSEGEILIGDYSTEIPKGTDAVDHTVYWVHANEDKTTITEPQTLTASIAKATDNAVLKDWTPESNLTYSNGSYMDLISARPKVRYGQVEYKVDDKAWSIYEPQANTAGEHTIKYRVVETDNYNGIEEVEATVTIAPGQGIPKVAIEVNAGPAPEGGSNTFSVNVLLPMAEAGFSHNGTDVEYTIGDPVVSENSDIVITKDNLQVQGVMLIGTFTGGRSGGSINIPVTLSSATAQDSVADVTVNISDALTFERGDVHTNYGNPVENGLINQDPNETYTFSSTDVDVAEVDQEGNVTVKHPGTTSIFAVGQNNKTKYNLRVDQGDFNGYDFKITSGSRQTYNRSTGIDDVTVAFVRDGYTLDVEPVIEGYMLGGRIYKHNEVKAAGTYELILSVEGSEYFKDRKGFTANQFVTVSAPSSGGGRTPIPAPTATPTAEPTATPTAEPTAEPTATPTAEPTATPTAEPTATPTSTPDPTPVPAPTDPSAEKTPASEPVVEEKTDETGATIVTTTVENTDGSKTEVIATTTTDGTVTETTTVTESNGDFAKTEVAKDENGNITATTESSKVTAEDGTTTETTKTLDDKGNSSEASKVTALDGTVKESEKTADAAGNTSELNKTTNNDGSVEANKTTKSADGSSTEASVKTNSNGYVSELKTTETAADGSKTSLEFRGATGDEPSGGVGITLTKFETDGSVAEIPSEVLSPDGNTYPVTVIAKGSIPPVEEVRIPESIEKLNKGAFKDSGVNNIVITGSVTKGMFEKGSMKGAGGKKGKGLEIHVQSKDDKKVMKKEAKRGGVPKAKIVVDD